MKINTNSDKHVVFLGEARFPYGLASVQRMTLMAKSLLHENVKTTIICRKGSWNVGEHPNFNYRGNFEGIDYIYTSKAVHKPKGFVKRNIQKIRGVYGEFTYLRNLKKQQPITMAILSNRKILHVLRYLLFAAYFDFPIVLNFVEMASSMQHRNGFLKRINDYINEKWVIRLFDGALPISDKLKNYYHGTSPNKPCLKIPVICDFDIFDVQKTPSEEYFLYCGSISYREVIDFIIDAYSSISDDENAKLYMIVSGESREETARFQDEINTRFKTQPIKLYSNIPYEQLVQLYTNAIALLIPLRDTVQDASRFPHKIGEYLASGNPVVTTNFGEIQTYFEDGKTALVASDYEVGNFAEKMKFVLENPEKAKEIGKNGYRLGLAEFDYKVLGQKLLTFTKNLSRQQ
ncbi:glycosyltransferase family 4 protein [Aggregatimonas sangjinii]|uniref:Glycosyltransferase family 4 protein n=1 Tax=Aggregatimonas sangjinii TaxID=2583587 RepID=A0A5B7SXP3_9FLAO|nr:glycosyltransferase [Aggregatimonas sangjinii]QCX01661.1 glycosyltransferase family 4 protein [Aggregatimonas sangjinii]